METPAQRLIQDFQNLNIIYHGTTPGGKIDGAKADMKKSIEAREKVADMKMDYEESFYYDVAARRVLPLSSKKKPENTMEHLEMDDDDDDEMPDMLEEAREKAADMKMVYEQSFYYDVAGRRVLPISYIIKESEFQPENTMKHFEMDDDDYEMPDMLEYFSKDEVLQCRKFELPGNCSPTCRSPSPQWIAATPELRLIETLELPEHRESSSFW